MTADEGAVLPVTSAQLASFTRQLGAMVEAGVDVIRALRIASRQTGNDRLIDAAEDLGRQLEDGREFHEGALRHRDIFDEFFIQMTLQGEADGTLGSVLRSVADYYEHLPEQSGAPRSGGALAGGGAQTAAPLLETAMTTAGVLALGAAALWATAASRRLPKRWLGPAATLWSGVCLLGGARRLHGMGEAPATAAPPAPLPPPVPASRKTPERQAAETEAVVLSALDEQSEEEALPLAASDLPEPWTPEDD